MLQFLNVKETLLVYFFCIRILTFSERGICKVVKELSDKPVHYVNSQLLMIWKEMNYIIVVVLTTPRP